MGFVTSDKARRYLRSLPKCPRSSFRALYPNADPQALDLLDKMLVFDPAKRISVQVRARARCLWYSCLIPLE